MHSTKDIIQEAAALPVEERILVGKMGTDLFISQVKIVVFRGVHAKNSTNNCNK
jgi:hypothetical protein